MRVMNIKELNAGMQGNWKVSLVIQNGITF